RLAERPTDRFSVPPYFNRRGFRLTRVQRLFHRGDRIRPTVTLFRLEGCVRPPRSQLALHLWLADPDHELLQQLWPLSLPRKAYPIDDHQRSRGAEASRVRDRRQRSRLALR